MSDFIEAFVRNSDGSWTCIAPVTLDTDSMRRLQVASGTTLVRGRKFMNVDLVDLLDRETLSAA